MRTSTTVTTLSALLLPAPANAVELLYTWNKGDVHRFQYEDATTMSVAMPGLAGSGKTTVASEFKLERVK